MTETCEQITLDNEDKIIPLLDGLCQQALEEYNSEVASHVTDYTVNNIGVYRSYETKTEDATELTQLLNDQGINPINYLVSVIAGEGGKFDPKIFKPHVDKQRHQSIMYIYSDFGGVTSFYNAKEGVSKPEPNVFFYNDDDIELIQSYELTEGNFYKFNHQTIHGVSNIFGGLRVNVTMTLSRI